MSEMKYVVVDSEEAGEQMFIFPKTINHNRVAEILDYIKHGDDRNWERIYREPVSAGFITDGKCHGKSETLGLPSRSIDTEIYQRGGIGASQQDWKDK